MTLFQEKAPGRLHLLGDRELSKRLNLSSVSLSLGASVKEWTLNGGYG